METAIIIKMTTRTKRMTMALHLIGENGRNRRFYTSDLHSTNCEKYCSEFAMQLRTKRNPSVNAPTNDGGLNHDYHCWRLLRDKVTKCNKSPGYFKLP